MAEKYDSFNENIRENINAFGLAGLIRNDDELRLFISNLSQLFTIFLGLLHSVVSTLSILAAVGVLLYVDITFGKDDDKFHFAVPISVSLLPWIYVFVRKEGIIPWTTQFRSKYRLIVTQYEIDEAIREKREARQAAEEKKRKQAEAKKKAAKAKRKLRKKTKLRKLLAFLNLPRLILVKIAMWAMIQVQQLKIKMARALISPVLPAILYQKIPNHCST